MLAEDSKFQDRLRGVIRKLASDPHLQEDLFQIGVVHVLLTEASSPEHTTSWYVDSCKHEMRKSLKQGRSVDSFKRRHLGCQIDAPEGGTPELVFETVGVEGLVLETVAAADLVEQLSLHLKPPEAEVLAALAEGYGSSEIAEQLGVTPQTVNNYRHKIAETALQIGLAC